MPPIDSRIPPLDSDVILKHLRGKTEMARWLDSTNPIALSTERMVPAVMCHS